MDRVVSLPLRTKMATGPDQWEQIKRCAGIFYEFTKLMHAGNVDACLENICHGIQISEGILELQSGLC